MSHRTYGETRDCRGCRFWSEMIAQGGGDRIGVEALCLSDDGPKAGEYTTARATCAAWKSGHHGAIDEPPNYGEQVRPLYDAEDKAA
jgi:hypothetical protein